MSPIEKLDALWGSMFGEAEPVPWTLRMLFPDRWVRFHSLPRGKRYAESSAEEATVLSRHNAVLDEILGPDQRVFLITAAYSDRWDTAARAPELLRLDGGAEAWRVVAMTDQQDLADDPCYLHLSTSVRAWSIGAFDPLLLLIADGKIADVMILSEASGAVYHPYDGGGDAILPSGAARDLVKQAHLEWLSDHLGGL